MNERRVLLAVEDELSAAVMCRVIATAGRDFVVDRVFNARGYGRLKASVDQFKSASRALPHIVLTDLDTCPCPPELLRRWHATQLPPKMLLRVVVRTVEAWLLADRAGIADFLSVAPVKVPLAPEAEANPKQTLITLARRSRKPKLAQALAPAAGSSASIGPQYNALLSGFVRDQWNVDLARKQAPSLDRTLTRLSTFLND